MRSNGWPARLLHLWHRTVPSKASVTGMRKLSWHTPLFSHPTHDLENSLKSRGTLDWSTLILLGLIDLDVPLFGFKIFSFVPYFKFFSFVPAVPLLWQNPKPRNRFFCRGLSLVSFGRVMRNPAVGETSVKAQLHLVGIWPIFFPTAVAALAASLLPGATTFGQATLEKQVQLSGLLHSF